MENADKYMERAILTSKVDHIQEYHKWIQEIPYFRIPEDCEIKILPPYGGTIVRFIIRRINRENYVSIYLDCYGTLGSVDKPYWEIYPYQEDTYRCYLNETDKLINAIEYALGNKRKYLNKKLTKK